MGHLNRLYICSSYSKSGLRSWWRQVTYEVIQILRLSFQVLHTVRTGVNTRGKGQCGVLPG